MKSLFSLEQYTKIFPRLRRKLSEPSQVGKRFIEWRKLRMFYGKPSQKYLQSLYNKSNCPSQTSFSFFQFLESRLDVVLYRAHFFESIASAKQQVRAGKIQVNNKKVISPGYNLLPGDIISVLSQDKINDKNKLVCLETGLKSRPLIVKKSKKKNGVRSLWRFQRSPFLLSISNKLFKKASLFSFNEKTSSFIPHSDSLLRKPSPLVKAQPPVQTMQSKLKTKTIGTKVLNRLSRMSFKDFVIVDNIKSWCLQNQFNFRTLSSLCKFFSDKKTTQNRTTERKFNSLVDYAETPLPISSISFANKAKQTMLNYSKNVEQDKNTRLEGPLMHIGDQQSPKLEESTYFFKKENKNFQVNNWFFLNFVLFFKKHALSSKRKLSCFFEQKNRLFFKEQFFFASKKTKPLHLEISYKSRCIVFLFPPQRVYFPRFIDLSQIYK